MIKAEKVTNTLYDTVRTQMKFRMEICGSKPCPFLHAQTRI